MRRELQDEQIEHMMRQLLSDASPDETELADIAGSPATWWAVQRSINAQKDAAKSPWPPVNIIRRWLMIAVPTAAAAALVVAFFVFRPAGNVEHAAVPAVPVSTNAPVAASIEPVTSGQSDPEPVPGPKVQQPVRRSQPVKSRATYARHQFRTSDVKTEQVASNTETTEVKTEFISLSYGGNAESGQIVRVKVPRSMMVSLGLVAAVEKPASLIDAEVIVGDDGLTRAIRFIRQ